jgi:hypothetical protein
LCSKKGQIMLLESFLMKFFLFSLLFFLTKITQTDEKLLSKTNYTNIDGLYLTHLIDFLFEFLWI